MKLLQFKRSDIAALAIAALLIIFTSVYVQYQSSVEKQSADMVSQNAIHKAGPIAQVKHYHFNGFSSGKKVATCNLVAGAETCTAAK